MNTFQLAQVLTKDPFTKGSFSGVYACDELTSIEINKYPKSFVVNTDPMELPGTHWIAIYFNEQMKGEFIDSYGKHPIHYNKHFLDFMNINHVLLKCKWHENFYCFIWKSLKNQEHCRLPFLNIFSRSRVIKV